MVGSDVELLDGDEDVGGVFLLGLVSDPAWQGLSQKVCGGGASSLEKRPGFLLWGVVLAREMSLNLWDEFVIGVYDFGMGTHLNVFWPA